MERRWRIRRFAATHSPCNKPRAAPRETPSQTERRRNLINPPRRVGRALKGTHHPAQGVRRAPKAFDRSAWKVGERRRCSIIQPGVARHELPRVCSGTVRSTLKGLHPGARQRGWRPPFQGWPAFARCPQGSSSLATLGCLMKRRWRNAPHRRASKIFTHRDRASSSHPPVRPPYGVGGVGGAPAPP